MSMQPVDADQGSLSYPPLDIQSTERIAQMARLHLRDLPVSFSARVMCNGAQWRFDLPFENLDSDSLEIVLSDGQTSTTLVSGTDFRADYRQGVIILNTPPPPNKALVTQGIYYKDFLPAELAMYVRIAYLQHIEGVDPSPQVDVWPLPQPPISPAFGTAPPIRLREIEEYPLSLQVAVLALESLATMVAQEADVRTPDGVLIPRSQIFQQLRIRIGDLEARYDKVAQALNIGLWRISVGNLRRVSRTTNRYVPQYVSREYDDVSMPQRILQGFNDKFGRIITDLGNYVVGNAYKKDQVVFIGGQRYIALQDVPAGKTPAADVDPTTGSGFYWAFTTINSSNWWGYW